jgi:uncharacterized protein (TIGR00290 family)
MRAFCSWSGGKESALAFYRAIWDGIEVKCLLNMVSEDGKRSRSHGISSKLIRLQADAMGIPIIQRKTTWENYEEEFKKALSDFRKEGVFAGIFGDIDLQEHRDWVERVCKGAGIKPVLPLWKEQREKLLEEFIDAGFKAVVVAVTDSLGEECLGRQIDYNFINDLKGLKDVDLCGEKGEYHTFVYNGPIFKKPVEFITGKKILRDKHWYLELNI